MWQSGMLLLVSAALEVAYHCCYAGWPGQVPSFTKLFGETGGGCAQEWRRQSATSPALAHPVGVALVRDRDNQHARHPLQQERAASRPRSRGSILDADPPPHAGRNSMPKHSESRPDAGGTRMEDPKNPPAGIGKLHPRRILQELVTVRTR